MGSSLASLYVTEAEDAGAEDEATPARLKMEGLVLAVMAEKGLGAKSDTSAIVAKAVGAADSGMRKIGQRVVKYVLMNGIHGPYWFGAIKTSL